MSRLPEILLTTTLLLAACGGRPAAEAPPRPVAEASADGATLFAIHCAMCHGPAGEGSAIVTAETNFSRPAWQAARSDAQIARTIREGVPEKGMAPFPWLDEAEVGALVGHVRSLATR